MLDSQSHMPLTVLHAVAICSVLAAGLIAGQMLAIASRDSDDIVIADLDLDLIREVRNTWQFYRDRRPETYGALVEP